MSDTGEQWKDIPGYRGYYQASDKGRIRSVPRTVRYADGRLKPGYAGRVRNYAFVRLSRNNFPRMRYVHDLVLLAFVGRKPSNAVVCHGRRGSQDNSLSNLQYGTPCLPIHKLHPK